MHNDPLVGKTLADRYQIRSQLSSGTMGTVYEAQHASLGHRLAVKVLKEQSRASVIRERFFHEARLAAGIEHPHVVQVIDFGLLDSGIPFLVMDYVDGTSLEKLIEKDAPLDIEEALEIASQVLSALEVIHGAGLVHRDIKPGNVLISRLGPRRLFAKLGDFGVARALDPGWKRPDLTRVDQIFGTPAYLAPEQAAGGEPDPRWDLWAMTTILYEMLSGQLPYPLESLDQLRDDLINHRRTPLRAYRPDLPPWLLEVVERGHHRSPDHRHVTASSFLEVLQKRSMTVSGLHDARTVPFYRVDASTPPPDLLEKLKASMPATSRLARPGDVLFAGLSDTIQDTVPSKQVPPMAPKRSALRELIERMPPRMFWIALAASALLIVAVVMLSLLAFCA
jgi:serine/threonine-protein kinase